MEEEHKDITKMAEEWIPLEERKFKSPHLKEYAIAVRDFRIRWKDIDRPDSIDEQHLDYLITCLCNHQKWMQFEKYEEDTTKLTEYMFITISPPSTVSLNESHSVFKKFIKKTNFKEYLYVIEQRGESDDDVGRGIHYHALVRTSYDRFSALRRDTHNTFKNIINLDDEKIRKHINEIINFKNCRDMTDVKNRIEYMTGIKKPVSKQIRQKYDTIFRNNNNLQSYYGNLHI